MTRNIVLALSTTAILILLFIGYQAIVTDPVEQLDRDADDVALLPEGETLQPEEVLQVSSAADMPAVEIPPGGAVGLTLFDRDTGRATDRFECAEWTPIAGSNNQVRVTQPKLTTLLPSGMLATISADSAQLEVDRTARQTGRAGRAQRGWLRDHVVIHIGPNDQNDAPSTRPATTGFQSRFGDQGITVELDTLEFDLELGQLKSNGPVRLRSETFELAGSGLHLVWNEIDNRLETLLLRKGDKLVFRGAGLLTGMQADKPESTAQATPAPAEDDAPQNVPIVSEQGEPLANHELAARETTTTQPHHAATPEDTQADQTRPFQLDTTYACTFEGGVRATQYLGEQAIAELIGRRIFLLFDVGSGAGSRFRHAAFGRKSTPAEQPQNQHPEPATAPTDAASTQPAQSRNQKLVLEWNGALLISPLDDQPQDLQQARRRFEAIGDPVILTHRDGTVRCARLEYYDDTQQIWLHPTETGRVHIALGKRMAAHATSIYIDQNAQLIKLIGDVEIASQDTPGAGVGSNGDMRCNLWAELHLARDENADTPADLDAPLAAGQLQSAVFVGNVRIAQGDQVLTAHRVDATFQSAGPDNPDLSGTLDRVLATGDVELRGTDDRLACTEMTLDFDLTDTGKLFPRHLHAYGSVDIARDDAGLRGEEVYADLAPIAARQTQRTAQQQRPQFALRNLRIVGDAELIDPENKIAARGNQISAAFTGANELQTAEVIGTPDHPAGILAHPYTVRGALIELDAHAQTLAVDGTAYLRFRTSRGLRGQDRGKEMLVRVHCDEQLLIDGANDRIEFRGNVRVASGRETLRAKELTLLLARLPEDQLETPQIPTLKRQLYRSALQALQQVRRSSERNDEIVNVDVEGRRELHRVIARQALVQSDEGQLSDGRPVVSSSIEAPLLEILVPEKRIETTGRTTLLVTSRRMEQTSAEAAEQALGVPSALLSRGPSQTAMQCDGSMTYVLGEGPDRRDIVLFRDGVVLAHVAGREIPNLMDMIPQLADDPERLASLESRKSRLECQRLECAFSVTGDNRDANLAGTAPLQLSWLMASGDVWLRDEQNAGIREVFAEHLDFNRDQSIIDVIGTDEIDARIYYQNTETGAFAIPAVGRQFTIDLRTNTVRADRTRGEFRRP